MPQEKTCDVYVPAVSEYSPKDNWGDPIFDKLFSYFIKKSVANDTNRNGDHIARIVNVIVSSLGGRPFHFIMLHGSHMTFSIKVLPGATWNGINTALLATSAGLTSAVADTLEDKVNKLNELLVTVEPLDVNFNLDKLNNRLDFDQDVGRDFEQQFLQNFDDVFKDKQSPCAFWRGTRWERRVLKSE